MRPDTSPTARALLALEAIQDSPGITAQRLGEHLGVSERAARRYVAILREADLPIESATGPNGGYRVGRGLRLPPLMFSAAEALGLVMAVLEGHRDAADPTELVGAALSKILRVLPQPVAEPLRAVRRTTGLQPEEHRRVDATITGQLVEACSRARRIHLTYRLGPETERPMEVDPWAVVLRHSRWYLFGYSHTRQAVRALRVDRIRSVFTTSQTFTPPQDLDALRALEEHLSQGWRHPVDVLFHDSFDDTARWVPRSLDLLEAAEAARHDRQPRVVRPPARGHAPDLRGARVAAPRAGHRGPREPAVGIRAMRTASAPHLRGAERVRLPRSSRSIRVAAH